MEHIKDILDQIQGWHIVLTIYGGCILWLVYEFFTAPLMPQDYDLSIVFHHKFCKSLNLYRKIKYLHFELLNNKFYLYQHIQAHSHSFVRKQK